MSENKTLHFSFSSDLKMYFLCVSQQYQNNEAEFLHKVEIGDYPGMVRLLENNSEINVDCEDRLSRSAITLAVRNEHLEVNTHTLHLCDSYHGLYFI